MIDVKKIKTEYRAVEFDGSEGSESFREVDELLEWADARGYLNCLDEYMPNIEAPAKKPSYPGETRPMYVQHGGYIVASSRGKVKTMTDFEFAEKFTEKG